MEQNNTACPSQFILHCMSLTGSELLLLALSSSVWWHSIRCIGKYNVAQTTHFVQCKDCELETLSRRRSSSICMQKSQTNYTLLLQSCESNVICNPTTHSIRMQIYILCYYWQKNEEWILSSVFGISIFSLQFHLQTAIFISTPKSID